MNLSTVRGIYNNVGTEKCNSMLIQKSKKAKKDTDDRPISENTINLIAGIINRYKNPTRRSLISKSYLSPSTVSNATRILFDRGIIKKTASITGSGRAVSYSIAKD